MRKNRTLTFYVHLQILRRSRYSTCLRENMSPFNVVSSLMYPTSMQNDIDEGKNVVQEKQ